MKAFRVPLALAGLMLLSASTLSAQSTKISCKDGSKPKVGHFACWGHGGLVREAANPAEKPAKKEKKPAKVKKAKATPAHHEAKATKKTGDKKHATPKKSHKKKHKKTPAQSVAKTNDDR